MNKIEKIRKEIERLKSTNPSEYNYQNAEGYIWALDDILSFIDTLEEEPDKDLDDEISRTYHDGSVADTSDLDHTSYENIARHFAEWQKEQMLKEAVEGKVYFQMGGIKRVKSDDFENPNIHLGDKVKLIIIKED